MWALLLLLILMELGCVGLWAATGSAMPLLPALVTGLEIVYLILFAGRLLRHIVCSLVHE